jgi:6-pyruvoyltetrahydropterin/6-carboxytetrahydropterin synthase
MRVTRAQYSAFSQTVAAIPILDLGRARRDMPADRANRTTMIEISQRFSFDAAHHLDAGAAENRRLHGHSFYVEVVLRGEPDAGTGFLRDFGQVDAALKAVRDLLDHRLLNEVEGLGNPTLENIARFIHARAKAALPEVARVRVERPSYGQSCTYEGA